jgi:WXG100 family type VII secretion target
MPNMNVTYADMEAAAGQLRNGQADIESRLQSLKSLVDSLVSSGYVTDRSSKAFEASYAEFNEGIKRTLEGLTGMSSYLTKASQAISQTDSELAQSLGR